jgi:hypothetical protein
MNNSDYQRQLDDLRAAKWHDVYLCRLALLDHLHECLEKDKYLKATDAPKNGEGYVALDKELADLKIILDLYFYNQPELLLQRQAKFLSKLRAD